ncbi:MAG: hypothetical protein R2822_07090 [Spirosomataceae bacterium]
MLAIPVNHIVCVTSKVLDLISDRATVLDLGSANDSSAEAADPHPRHSRFGGTPYGRHRKLLAQVPPFSAAQQKRDFVRYCQSDSDAVALVEGFVSGYWDAHPLHDPRRT